MELDMILTIAGIIISGLFAVTWYFVQAFIKRTETSDSQLVETLDKLNVTMTELNTNLLVFRTSATDEFNSINAILEELKACSDSQAKELDSLKTRVQKIEVHHSRNHPNDKM